MSVLTVNAPAKINLTLEITGKRQDGYHNLRSIMQSVSLFDIVRISLNSKENIVVTCSDGNIPFGKNNIAYKAAEVFFEYAGISGTGTTIEIEKHIPSQAGLGGGSADAAAVITALNILCKSGFSTDELCRLGTKVGADVPFCICGGTVLCEGIGEILTPLTPLEDCIIVLGKGKTGFSTKEAYETLDALKRSDNCVYRELDISVFTGSINNAANFCFNVFESVLHNSETDAIHNIMNSCGALNSIMSGSGSAIYSFYSDRTKADLCCSRLKSEGFFSCICRPIGFGPSIE